MKKLLICGLIVLTACLALPALAAADDDVIEDTYVAPLDEDGSDEQLREEGGSGFDTPGPVYIPEDDYDAGTPDDGTWDPDVPPVSPPEPVEGE